jgi:hypothetical protein
MTGSTTNRAPGLAARTVSSVRAAMATWSTEAK